MSDTTNLVQRYFEIWNETDPDIRLAAIERLWTDDAHYVDPLAAVTGHEEISALIGAVHRQLPGHVFRLLDGIDAHHNLARFSWELVPAEGGASLVEGFDVAVTEHDGRISRVLGFLDKAPAA
jgi:ketosteroid isomerase-like protein